MKHNPRKLRSTSTPNLAHAISASPLHTVVIGEPTGNVPLLVLHGWEQTLEVMRPLGERLSWNRQVHLIDLPGFGQSPWSGQDWNTRDYAMCILSYMDKRGIRQADLLGHSFGGRIALRITSEWSGRVRRLVLIDSAGLPPKRNFLQKSRMMWIRCLGILFALLPDSLSIRLLRWHGNRYGSDDYRNAGVLRGTLVKTVIEDQTTNASLVKAPTLLLWGECDTATPVEMAYRFHHLIPNSKIVVLPNKDHFSFMGDGVHQCTQIVGDFLLDPDDDALEN